MPAPVRLPAAKCPLLREVRMAGSGFAFGPVGKFKLAGKRLIFTTVLFFFKKVVCALE